MPPITGQSTHFVQDFTQVAFGPNVTVNSVTVLSLTELQADVTINGDAAFGWRPV